MNYELKKSLHSLMDRMWDSGSLGCGSIPHGGTKKSKTKKWSTHRVNHFFYHQYHNNYFTSLNL